MKILWCTYTANTILHSLKVAYFSYRKKFFVLNGDISEAMIKKKALLDLLYNQVRVIASSNT